MNPFMRRLFSIALRSYPRDFREHYQDSMIDHFESEGGGWRETLRAAGEMLLSALTMRVENVWRDLLYALRMNVKAPLFTLVIVSTIALAIATNTVVFALLNAVLLKPLPYANPDRLGFVWQQSPQDNGQRFTTLSNGQTDALARSSKSFASVTGATSLETVSTDGGVTLQSNQVKNNYFSTLGIRPVLGRFLNDGLPQNQAVISWAVWHSRFGADSHVVGRQIKLQGTEYTIVGVAPPDMLDPAIGSLSRTDVWTKPPQLQPGSDVQYPMLAIVRLRDGVSWQAAQADVTRVEHLLSKRVAPFPGTKFYTGPLSSSLFQAAQSFLWLVFAAVTGVLLIACANVANLLLARGAVREGEFAVRSAIGASASRIAAQVFTETLLLAATGALIGLALAWETLPWAKSIIPGNFPRLQYAGIDSAVLLYVCALVIGVTLLTGMVPAYKRRAKGRRDVAARMRPVLVVVEIAVAFALTAAFGVMLHSFVSMTSVPLGFQPGGLYIANVHPNGSVLFSIKFTPSQAPPDYAGSVRAIPGVVDATEATGAPFENTFQMAMSLSQGWNGQHGGAPMIVNAIQVGASYFKLLRIPVLAGSGFTETDFRKKTGSVIVNESFARRYFPRENVIGKRVGDWHVVAVVKDVRSSFRNAPAPILYLPFNGGFGPYFGILIRTAHPVPALARQVAAAITRQNPSAGTVSLSSLDDLIAKDASGMRTSLELFGALAAVALLLGLCGIYSVVAYGTERRFHEIGIRLAVGARPWNIISLIIGDALVQGAIGVVAGLVLCGLTMQLLASQLYKTSPLDPPSLAAVIALIIACTGCASAIPAFRAAFARPSATLRYE